MSDALHDLVAPGAAASRCSSPRRRLVTAVLGLAAWLPRGAPAQAGAAAPAKVVISGSSAMAPLIAELARRHQAADPDFVFAVEAGDAARALGDVRAGRAELGMVARDLTPAEKKEFFFISVARDGIALIVHRDSPLRAISRTQLTALLQGRVTSWKALDGREAPVHVVTRTPGDAALAIVAAYGGMKADEVVAQRVAGSTAEAARSVIENPNAFAFVSFAAAIAAVQRGEALRLLAVDGVEPSPGALRSGRYPLTRSLNLVMRGVPAGAVRAFVVHVQSPQARVVIEAHGFVAFGS